MLNKIADTRKKMRKKVCNCSNGIEIDSIIRRLTCS
jgi:hypothetical protein